MPNGLDLDSEQLAKSYNAGCSPDGASRSVIGFSLPTREAVDERYTELTGAGYTGLQPPYDTFWGARYAIVLVDQINLELSDGRPVLSAIIDSGASRLRPVGMAAFTTALGMIPLLFDAFLIAMAITIIFGLLFATVLTMVVLPVLYAIVYGVRSAEAASAAGW